MRSSYKAEDVSILLKDISGMVEPLPAPVREKYIQKGVHYSEMLPLEYKPSPQYMQAYEKALDQYGKATATAVGSLAEKLYARKGPRLVIVSLARAGLPIGILLKRYLRNKYQAEIPHYAISIIRGKGIDKNAVNYILKRQEAEDLQFVDGWIGKGAILGQLKEALKDFPSVDPSLAVVSDPANLTDLCGTHEDILIPSSCLNATVTGLISRTFLRGDLIGEGDFHGAAYYGELAGEDLSEDFLERISAHFDYAAAPREIKKAAVSGPQIVSAVAREYGISDLNLIKPGIGETTRVLLRRIPWKILVRPDAFHAPELGHIFQLAAEKGVPCEPSMAELGNYRVCGLIRQLSDL